MADPRPVPCARRGDRPRAHAGTSDTEQAIFAATERLLVAEPLRDLSVAQIITEAGISRATFYFYFSSKFAVLVGLLGQVMDEIFEAVQPFVNRAPEDSPADAIRRSLAGTIELWSRHRPALAAVHEHWTGTEELRGLWLQVIERFTVAVTAEIERERVNGIGPTGVDSRALATTLLWGTERTLYIAGLGLEGGALPDESAALAPLTAMWLGTLFAQPPAT